MDLKEILAVSGQPRLFKFVAQSPNGVIVEAVATGKRTKFSANSRVSSLGDISVFTMEEDLPLEKVFAAFYNLTEGKQTISHKSSAEELKKVFGEAVPQYDRDQVRVSDMVKIVNWYNLLVEHNLYEPAKDEAEQEGADNE
jgi:hypothetical protein